MFQIFSKNKESFFRPPVKEYASGVARNLFTLENVSVDYGSIQALSNVNFVLEKGEVVFITGASGAGKTTLLKLLSGIEHPTKGSVHVPPKNIFLTNVFQDLKLSTKLSCEDNLWVAYDPNIYSSKEEFRSDLNELCKILGVKNRLHVLAKDANGGLKQKISIIRSLLTRPDIFIADEPSSSLDFENAKKVFEVLSLYNLKRGLTVVWASHNKELVKRFTGRIVHLENGKMVYSGHACFI